jgi:hypothetical protein
VAAIVTGEQVMDAARAVMLTPWVWGQADCCTSVCDVVLALYGVDPMADLRGLYDGQAGADAISEAAGGFLELAAGIAAAAGFVPVSGPAWPGDVGVTVAGVHQPDRRALAICVGTGWACKSPRGLTVVRKVERAWRFAG